MIQTLGLRCRGQRSLTLASLVTALAVAGITAASAATTPRTYRYFRFSQTALRVPATTLIQVSEFRFYNGATALPMAGVTVTNPGGNSPANENPPKLVDGNTATKWLDFNKQPVIFDFGSSVTVDRYDFSTANDAPERDPVSWTLEGSNDSSNWVVLDIVKNNSTPTQRGTAAAPYVTNPDVLTLEPVTIGEFIADKTVILNGDPVELTWTSALADNLSINQGIGSVAASASTPAPTLPSNADTTFTLSGTNADGAHAASVVVRSVAGGASNFRYIRFTPTKLRQGHLANSIQLAELQFLSGITVVTPTAVTNPGGNTPAAEGPAKLYDNSLDSKWLDFNKQRLVFDFGAPTAIDGYYMATANDNLERDPVRWTMEGSDDQTTWTLIENMTTFDFPTPVARKSFTQDIPMPGASVKPAVDLAGDAPKLVSGEPLVLTWTSQAAATVSIDNGVGSVATNGSVTLTPLADTTYTLTATSSGGTVTTATFAVDVITPPVTTIAYQNFDNAGEELALLGTATVLNDFANYSAPGDFKRLRLNADLGSQTGTAWFRKRMNLATGFQTFFDLQMITLGATTGADGMAFVVQNAPQGTGAVPTGAAEEGLAANALNLKFDSYDNGDADPSAATVQVRAGTTVLSTADLTTFPSLMPLPGTYANDMTMTSGSTAPYQVRVDYVPGDLDVYFNNVLVIDSVNVNLATIGALDSNGKAYVGFAGRSGGFFESHDVTRWTLTEGPPSVVPAGPLVIKSHAFNFATDSLQLTWGSSPAKTYKVTASTDATSWTTVLASGIPGAAGQQETTATVNFTEGARGFFRVEEE